ncbi:hypothetical protein [Pannonibacter sp.]|uniref:hypothetical protein n=1 Tax=Pannonibacter sp. TaxID=1906786 RepID=UPI003F6F3844
MDFNPQWITLVMASTAMIASIASPFVNTRVARTQFKANVLSVNRQKWVEAMRDLVASLNSQFLMAAAVRQTLQEPPGKVIVRDPELLVRVENLLRTVCKIELMLNPMVRDHQMLNNLMKEAVDQLRAPLSQESVEERIEGIIREIARVSKAILNRECILVDRGE